MQILQTLSIVFSIIVCLLLLFLILIQSGKGGSIGIFGGGSSSTAFGASTMDVVTKFTWWLAAAFFAFAILAALAFAEGTPSLDPEQNELRGLGDVDTNNSDTQAQTIENRKEAQTEGLRKETK